MTANVLILSAAGMLVSGYLMVGQKALFTTIRLYGLQSLLLAIVAFTIAIAESRHELFVTAGLTVALKAIVIPWFLMRTVDRIGIHREIEPVAYLCSEKGRFLTGQIISPNGGMWIP
jgi:hydrogenase-4 component E